MSGTLTVAIVGAGLIGAKRAEASRSVGRVVACVDPALEKAAHLAKRHHGAAVHSSLTGLFEAGIRPDLVCVCTTHDQLAINASLAIRSGCHVLVEKPGALDAAQARELEMLAERYSVVLRTGYNHRFHPSIVAIREDLADSGEAIFSIRARYGHGGRIGYESEWRADRARSGGGELIDQGLHLVDMTRFFAGPVELAFAEVRNAYWDMQVEDNAYLALRFSAGFAWLHASWTEWKNLFSLEISTESVKYEVSGLGGSYGVETLVRYQMKPEMGPPDVVQRQWDEPDSSWTAEMRDVAAAIRGERCFGATGADATAALEVAGAAYQRGARGAISRADAGGSGDDRSRLAPVGPAPAGGLGSISSRTPASSTPDARRSQADGVMNHPTPELSQGLRNSIDGRPAREFA